MQQEAAVRERTSLSLTFKSSCEFTLESRLESVAQLEAAAHQFAAEAGLDETECFHVSLALCEAAANAVLHGNCLDSATRITAHFENTGAALEITIADQGNGLNPESLPNPLAAENLLLRSGRGIFLIRSYMDEVHFRELHPGTALILVKYLPLSGENGERSCEEEDLP
jgi:serine/threonine-protein kinase RsbW